MKKRRGILRVLGGLVLASLQAFAGEVKVIANSNIPANSISAAELRSIFLEERPRFAGTAVEPVLQQGNAQTDTFLRKYLEKDEESLDYHYRTLTFTGKGSMPKVFTSDEQVVDYVSKTRGAIGYVSEGTAIRGAKQLTVVPVDSGGERALISRVEPVYPDLLRKLHVGGNVRLQLTISRQGAVENVLLLGGNPILAESATDAVKRWVFAPGRSRTTLEVSIPFDPQR